ncbi:MAG: phage head-tail connector protein [Clostridium sp.]|uniref:phage head-tail connector protein n=1 Tax=Clostridium sp. TaxID=1506 RepID=UPI002A84BB21|nr:phage head-tail connector protein [Clostridium sp.]MDY5096700.1 phage head-tail connector protein [Clostridium sp.]
MTQLEKLKIRLPDAEDALLNQLLEDAENDILDYTNRNVLLPKMEGLQRELAIIYYNRMGSEGETSRSEGGISVSYEMPQSIKDRLKAYRRLKAVSIVESQK